jgi:hypothetical protein
VGEEAIGRKLGLPAETAGGFARELLDWGVVRLVDDDTAFVTERDPWEFFLQIVGERHRREFLPVLHRMRATLSSARTLAGALPHEHAAKQKVEQFSGFIEELSRLIDLFVRLGAKPMALVLKTLAKFAPRA